MPTILLLGIHPDAADYTDPALPPGLTPDIIRAGIAQSLHHLRTAGHHPHHCLVPPDASAIPILAEHLARLAPAVVVVGGGIRLPQRLLPLFEAILNTIAQTRPTPAIALVSRPDEAPQAVARVLPLDTTEGK